MMLSKQNVYIPDFHVIHACLLSHNIRDLMTLVIESASHSSHMV
jgi:hypothetical protein